MYYVIGLISMSFTFPSFSIPVFGKLGSNMKYVQDLDRESNVKKMLEYSYDNSIREEFILFESEDKTVNVGEKGKLAFSLAKEVHMIESKELLTSLVNAMYNDISVSPFTKLSMARFLQKNDDEEELIKLAAESFKNQNVREKFISIEINYMNNNKINEEISNKIKTIRHAPNFITTHKLVSDLNARKENFAPRHFGEAMDAFLANNQVYWIGKDADILEFFQFLTKYHTYDFTEEEKIIINDYFLS